MLPDVEEQLLAWIEGLRDDNQQVRRSSIQAKALELATSDGDEGSFSASRGWLDNFLRRQNLSQRRRTTVSQRLPRELVPMVVSFILKTRELRLRHKYRL